MRDEFLENAMNTYGNTVLRVAYSVLRNLHDAEDIFSDVFLSLYQYGNNFNDEHHIKAWLVKVATNKALNLKKSFYRNKNVMLHEGIEAPEQGTESEVLSALEKLEPNDRVILHLHYFEGYSFKEIAQALKINENSVRSKAMRAKEKMKDYL